MMIPLDGTIPFISGRLQGQLLYNRSTSGFREAFR
jgi:hypothetical protein